MAGSQHSKSDLSKPALPEISYIKHSKKYWETLGKYSYFQLILVILTEANSIFLSD